MNENFNPFNLEQIKKANKEQTDNLIKEYVEVKGSHEEKKNTLEKSLSKLGMKPGHVKEVIQKSEVGNIEHKQDIIDPELFAAAVDEYGKEYGEKEYKEFLKTSFPPIPEPIKIDLNNVNGRSGAEKLDQNLNPEDDENIDDSSNNRGGGNNGGGNTSGVSGGFGGSNSPISGMRPTGGLLKKVGLWGAGISAGGIAAWKAAMAAISNWPLFLGAYSTYRAIKDGPKKIIGFVLGKDDFEFKIPEIFKSKK